MKKVLFLVAFVHSDNVLLADEQFQKLLEQKTKTDVSFFNYFDLSFNIIYSSLKIDIPNNKDSHESKIGLQLALSIIDIIEIDFIGLGSRNPSQAKIIIKNLYYILNFKLNIKNTILKIFPTSYILATYIPNIKISLHPLSYIESDLRIFNKHILGKKSEQNAFIAEKRKNKDEFNWIPWKKYDTHVPPIPLTNFVSISIGYNIAPRLLSFVILEVTPGRVGWLVNIIANIYLLHLIHNSTIAKIKDDTLKKIAQLIFFSYEIGYSFENGGRIVYSSIKPYENLISNIVSTRNHALFSIR